MAHESELSARSSGSSSEAHVELVHGSVVHRDAAVDARHPATQRRVPACSTTAARARGPRLRQLPSAAVRSRRSACTK